MWLFCGPFSPSGASISSPTRDFIVVGFQSCRVDYAREGLHCMEQRSSHYSWYGPRGVFRKTLHMAPAPPGRLRPSRRWALPRAPSVAAFHFLTGKAQGERESGSAVPTGPSAPKHWDTLGLAGHRARFRNRSRAWEAQAAIPVHPAAITSSHFPPPALHSH